jgi:hypothetical protein
MSFITGKQIQIVQIARRQVEKLSGGVFDDAAYQLALANCDVAPGPDGRRSSKSLTQAGFEKYMAIMESMGFRQRAEGDDQHWRTRNSRRTGFATSRQVYVIREHAKRDTRYPLYALCRRVSNDQHNEPEKLTVGQARKLIEAMKSITSREAT